MIRAERSGQGQSADRVSGSGCTGSGNRDRRAPGVDYLLEQATGAPDANAAECKTRGIRGNRASAVLGGSL